MRRPMTTTALPYEAPVALSRTVAAAALVALIVLGLAWELWLAPVRPGGSWLAVKVLPLSILLDGLVNTDIYTYRWVSLLVWLYFTEGVVRATSDSNPVSIALAVIEVLLCLLLFAACALHVRWRLKHAPAGGEAGA